MMLLMGKLFHIESALKARRDQRGLADEQFHELRAKVRTRGSAGIVEAISDGLADLQARHEVLPKSEIGSAVTYAMNQWQTSIAFLELPEAELGNNSAARAIRQVALGRKNWMFVGRAKDAPVTLEWTRTIPAMPTPATTSSPRPTRISGRPSPS